MIEERIDELIETYNNKIDVCKRKKESYKASYKYCLDKDVNKDVNGNANVFAERYDRCITHCNHKIAMYESFIESLEYAKTGERK